MKLSQVPSNTFVKFDALIIYFVNGVYMMAMPGQPLKKAYSPPIDVSVVVTTKEAFIEAVNGADITKDSNYQHILKGIFLEIVRKVTDYNTPEKMLFDSSRLEIVSEAKIQAGYSSKLAEQN